ncbi:hypothetical protein SAOR_01855 [Salinisphaera orenii MK-B5]|uniref:SPOR domain-containing protein n=1 Tax=Salinisphaera orenii MK-B5 TaxID=856730 RepID=A0A423PYE3_9GAMM|nr:hypothetical protein [Salinisphaera orenii]ROO30626.1 hypothetical protein SAOR_01855 [Salinisphaera orenii MK-B5]
MSEFPEPSSEYYVTERFELAGGQTVTEFVAGPFDDPDDARHARDFIRRDAPSRRVRCVEVVSFGDCLSGPKEKAARSES